MQPETFKINILVVAPLRVTLLVDYYQLKIETFNIFYLGNLGTLPGEQSCYSICIKLGVTRNTNIFITIV